MHMHELEDLIMTAWSTKEDIGTVLWCLFDKQKEITEDDLGNLLIGIMSLHDARMSKLFAAYEQVLKANTIVYKEYDLSQNTPTV